MQPIHLLLCLALLGGIHCTPILKIAYGIKDPKVESPETVQRQLRQWGLDTAIPNYHVMSLGHWKQLGKTFGTDMPEALFFDKNGRYVDYHLKADCNANVERFIDQLNPDTTLLPDPDTTRNLRQLLSHLQPPLPALNNNADYTAVFVWGRFGGKVMKDHLRPWITHAQNQQKVKLQFFLLNMDFQDYWGYPLGEKVKNLKSD